LNTTVFRTLSLMKIPRESLTKYIFFLLLSHPFLNYLQAVFFIHLSINSAIEIIVLCCGRNYRKKFLPVKERTILVKMVNIKAPRLKVAQEYYLNYYIGILILV
jgi:hypothetical protein